MSLNKRDLVIEAIQWIIIIVLIFLITASFMKYHIHMKAEEKKDAVPVIAERFFTFKDSTPNFKFNFIVTRKGM